jgi:hypothetical protein
MHKRPNSQKIFLEFIRGGLKGTYLLGAGVRKKKERQKNSPGPLGEGGSRGDTIKEM